MNRKTELQNFERRFRAEKTKEDKFSLLWDEVRDLSEELQAKENQLADLCDAIQEIVMFGPTETGLAYLSEIYAKVFSAE